MRRNCVQVIDQIIDKIPSHYYSTLEKALIDAREFAGWRPPEETVQWKNLQEVLLKFIYPPTTDWHYEIWSIFSTVPVEEIKRSIR